MEHRIFSVLFWTDLVKLFGILHHPANICGIAFDLVRHKVFSWYIKRGDDPKDIRRYIAKSWIIALAAQDY